MSSHDVLGRAVPSGSSTVLGKWSGWKDTEPIQLGSLKSYQDMVTWLDGYGDIADWGGGTGFAQYFVKQSRYCVLDGSISKLSHVLIDLAHCDVSSECIMLRHVLEHNYNWQAILRNVVKNFTRRAAVAISTPLLLGPTTFDHEESGFLGSVGESVPVLHLCRFEVLSIIGPFLHHTDFRGRVSPAVPDETIFYLEKA